MTLSEKLKAQIAEDQQKDRRGYDWHQLTEEDEFVFGIDPDEWPAMMNTYFYYEIFKGCAKADYVDGADGKLFAQAHIDYPQWPGDRRLSVKEFQDFAKEIDGLSYRSAKKVYAKMEAWYLRTGHYNFKDEVTEVRTINRPTDPNAAGVL